MTQRTHRSLRMLIMSRLALLSFLFAVPLLGQTGQLSVRFTSETRTPNPDGYSYLVRLGWTGAEPARDLVLTVNVPGTVVHVAPINMVMTCTTANPVRCTVPLLTNGHDLGGVSVTVKLPGPGSYSASASLVGSVGEVFASHQLHVTGLPSLRGSLLSRDDTVDPGRLGTIDLTVTNSGAAATNVIMRARIEGGEIVRAEPLDWAFGPPASTCTIANGEVACHIPAMRGGRDFELVRLTYRAPDRREGGRVVVTGVVASDVADEEPENDSMRAEVTLRRMFTVTSAEDAGAGTLRQAILESGVACEKTPCTIAFEGVAVVQPRTALPELRGMMRILGDEPRVFLDGSLVAAGDGLLFAGGCGLDVRNMVVRNFPGHGIEGRQSAAERGPCPFHAIGLYVSKSVLSNNERGIVTRGIDASLKENFLHDHRRTGIFIDGSYYSEIFNNVVVDNGATGIFINTSTESQFGGIPPGADVIENVVHGNGEWGIVRTRNAGLVQMRRNSTIRNGLYGIDVGLDLSTPNREHDTGGGVPNKPLLESATYDAASNTTVIRGAAPWGSRIDLYASSSLSRRGHPESELYLGELVVLQNGRIEMRVPADLRGLWITGTMTRSQTLYFMRDEDAKPRGDVWRPPTGYDTSELSDPVQVH